jgi:predicted nuclease with RNAse H fold
MINSFFEVRAAARVCRRAGKISILVQWSLADVLVATSIGLTAFSAPLITPREAVRLRFCNLFAIAEFPVWK